VPTDGSRPKTYRGAVIGAGGIARGAHIPALRQEKAVRSRLEVVAVVDSAPDVTPVEGLPLVRDLAELERFGPLDFLDICTPTASHLGLVLWGLERGLHVICEKPVALDRAEAARIAAAARGAGRVVWPCHQYRYNPAWRQVQEWLAGGVIGRWHLAEFAVYRQFADPGSRPGAPWRGSSGAGRGGVLLDHGTHLLYQVLDVAGWPAAVRAYAGRLRHQSYDVEDTAEIVLEYPGRVVTLFLTWAARQRETRLRFVGERGTIEWNGGELRLESPERAERVDFTRELDKASYWHWFASLFADFIVAIDRAELDPALGDIARVATLLELCYTASRVPGLPASDPP
jgi:predicted dehydrogenase